VCNPAIPIKPTNPFNLFNPFNVVAYKVLIYLSLIDWNDWIERIACARRPGEPTYEAKQNINLGRRIPGKPSIGIQRTDSKVPFLL
jgi:hypothetical protein